MIIFLLKVILFHYLARSIAILEEDILFDLSVYFILILDLMPLIEK